MLKNLQLKFIKEEYFDLEIWDDYLDKKFEYIIEQIILNSRFKNFSELYQTFEMTFNIFDAPKFSFSNSDIDTQIKIKIRNFIDRLRKCDFIVNISNSKYLDKIDHSFLTLSILENNDIDKSRYLNNLVIQCKMTENLVNLRNETLNFIIKLILSKIKYKILHVHESDINTGLLEVIQKIYLKPLLKLNIKNLGLSLNEFNIYFIINKTIKNIVREEFMKIENATNLEFIMSSNPYIKYSVKFKMEEFYKDLKY